MDNSLSFKVAPSMYMMEMPFYETLIHTLKAFANCLFLFKQCLCHLIQNKTMRKIITPINYYLVNCEIPIFFLCVDEFISELNSSLSQE